MEKITNLFQYHNYEICSNYFMFSLPYMFQKLELGSFISKFLPVRRFLISLGTDRLHIWIPLEILYNEPLFESQIFLEKSSFDS